MGRVGRLAAVSKTARTPRFSKKQESLPSRQTLVAPEPSRLADVCHAQRGAEETFFANLRLSGGCAATCTSTVPGSGHSPRCLDISTHGARPSLCPGEPGAGHRQPGMPALHRGPPGRLRGRAGSSRAGSAPWVQRCEAESLESDPGFHVELRTAASSSPLGPSVHASQVPHFEGPRGEARTNSQGCPLPGSQCNKGGGALISLSGPQAGERVVLAQRVCVRSKEGHTGVLRLGPRSEDVDPPQALLSCKHLQTAGRLTQPTGQLSRQVMTQHSALLRGAFLGVLSLRLEGKAQDCGPTSPLPGTAWLPCSPRTGNQKPKR